MILSMRSIWLGDCADRGTRRLGDGEVGEIFYGLFSVIQINFENLYDLYGFKFWVGSTKLREILHRDARSFFDVDCVERVAQRRFTRTSFKFQVSDFKFLNVDFFGTWMILI